MQLIYKSYSYKKHIDGIGRYGKVELGIDYTSLENKVVDECTWKIFKESHTNFVESGILKIWKQSAITAATSIQESYASERPSKIIIRDIVGLVVDSKPSHIGAAIIIGIFDLWNSPLSENDLKNLDEFVSLNSDQELIPEYDQLIIDKPRRR